MKFSCFLQLCKRFHLSEMMNRQKRYEYSYRGGGGGERENEKEKTGWLWCWLAFCCHYINAGKDLPYLSDFWHISNSVKALRWLLRVTLTIRVFNISVCMRISSITSTIALHSRGVGRWTNKPSGGAGSEKAAELLLLPEVRNYFDCVAQWVALCARYGLALYSPSYALYANWVRRVLIARLRTRLGTVSMAWSYPYGRLLHYN